MPLVGETTGPVDGQAGRFKRLMSRYKAWHRRSLMREARAKQMINADIGDALGTYTATGPPSFPQAGIGAGLGRADGVSPSAHRGIGRYLEEELDPSHFEGPDSALKGE